MNFNLLFTDEDGIEDLFDDYPLTNLKQKIVRDNSWKSEENLLSAKCEHNKPIENPMASSVPVTTKVNFVDCEESNGEDDDDDDEEAADTPLLVLKQKPIERGKCSVECTDVSEKKPDDYIQENVKAAGDVMPKWSTFFQSVEEDDALGNENHVESSGKDKNSQSPILVSDSDDSTHISSLSSSQSTHISEQGSQGWDSQADTVLVSSQERRAAEMASVRRSSYSIPEGDLPEETKPGGQSTVNCDPILNTIQSPSGVSKNQGEAPDPTKRDRKAESQSSSDFEIPSSPGAELPHPAKLQDLYQRLATGDAITALQQD